MPYDLLSLCLLGRAPALPGTWTTAWSLAPALVLPLLAWLVVTVWCAPASGCADRRDFAAGQRGLWFVGWCLLAAALVSPLCRLAATVIAGHMAQLLVLSVAAPLLMALGTPAQPRRGRASSSFGAGLLPATLAYAAILWLRHLPAVYDAALTSPSAHVVVVLLVVISSLWFWHAVLQVSGTDAGGTGRAVMALLATTAQTGLLGALLTFAPTPFYPLQAGGATAWGLSPSEDQQLAGLLMWVPGSLAYLAVGVVLAMRHLQGDARSPTASLAADSRLLPTARSAAD